MQNCLVVDLSHHNPEPDFAQAKAAGLVGVIHKATQGTGFVDSRYAARKQAALDAGLLWGAYHFGTDANVPSQVDHFINTVNPDGSFFVALDFERNDPDPQHSMQLADAKRFLDDFANKTGLSPTLYTGQYVFDTVGNHADPDLARHRVWWARYRSQPDLHPSWSEYFLWQYTDGTHGPLGPKQFPGVGPCDCNHYDGTAAGLQAAWLQQAFAVV
jgi:lysozyme